MIKDGKILIICDEVTVYNNTGNWGESLPGWHIIGPMAGFVDIEFWKHLKTFQSLSMTFLKSKDAPEFIEQWNKLNVDSDGAFTNTLIEFPLLVGVPSEGEGYYNRGSAQMGKKLWREV